jgi:sulfur relay (sulfurtransferase) DsrF/TusC family protein
MVFSSQPFLNIEDPSLDADTIIFVGYDSSMNVEMLPKEDGVLQILENAAPGNVAEDDVENAHGVDAYISKLHLTNLEKQHVVWKHHKHNSPTLVFFKVNKNQPINLF